jgi:hypothetical protein
MTESQIAGITKALGRIEKHLDRQDERFDHQDTRFNGCDERLDRIDGRLETHVAGPGAKRTAATGGGVAAVVTAMILALFEGLKRLGS